MASSSGLINHFGAVRLRVTGSGSLQMRLLSLDEVKTSTLVPLTMSTTTNREPVRLSNFNEQRAALEIKTTSIDEIFIISKIVIFTKPVAVEFPG